MLLAAPSTSRSCRSGGIRTAPTRGCGTGGWATGTPFEATRECSGEHLIAHWGSLLPEALNQPPLLIGEVMTVSGEGAFEVLPRLAQKIRISCGLPR